MDIFLYALLGIYRMGIQQVAPRSRPFFNLFAYVHFFCVEWVDRDKLQAIALHQFN